MLVSLVPQAILILTRTMYSRTQILNTRLPDKLVIVVRLAVHAGAFAGVSVQDRKTSAAQARSASAKLLSHDLKGTFAHCMAKKLPWNARMELPV